MPRLTITLSDDRHRALKDAAVRRRKTIRQIIEESLDFYGIKTSEDAAALVARARRASGLSEAEALELAINETNAGREKRAARGTRSRRKTKK